MHVKAFELVQVRNWYSVYWLYWYNSTQVTTVENPHHSSPSQLNITIMYCSKKMGCEGEPLGMSRITGHVHGMEETNSTAAHT
jgi:hypothetical protein